MSESPTIKPDVADEVTAAPADEATEVATDQATEAPAPAAAKPQPTPASVIDEITAARASAIYRHHLTPDDASLLRYFDDVSTIEQIARRFAESADPQPNSKESDHV